MNKFLYTNNTIIENSRIFNVFFINSRDVESLREVNLPTHLLNEISTFTNITRIDFFKNFIYGNILLTKYAFSFDSNLFFIIKNNILYFIYDDTCNVNLLMKIIKFELEKHIKSSNDILFIISLLINVILKNDDIYATKLQSSIDKLENTLIVDKDTKKYNVKLLHLNKQLSKFKKSNDDINSFIENINFETSDSDEIQQYIKLVNNKSNRISSSIKYMLSHIKHIKENYYSQIGVNLNHSMNLFIAVCAVFLPLIFIASWYSMNYEIPEFTFTYGYLIPVVISLVALLLTFYWIKKFKFLSKNK